MGSVINKLSAPAAFLATEFVIIVLGVLAAFAVDEWRDARAQDELRAHLIDGLISDLEEDAVDYAEFVDASRTRITAAEFLLSQADELQAGGSVDAVSVGDALFQIGRSPRLETVVSTFSEMTSSGSGAAIGDATLRIEISSYYGLARDRADINQTLLPGMLSYRRALEELGFSFVDRERITAEVVLRDRRILAIIRGIAYLAEVAVALGEDLGAANRALLDELLEVRARGSR